jgi:hypothetical protein
VAADSNAGGCGTPVPPGAVLIKAFHSSVDADMAASILRANHISAWLQTDDCGGMYPSLDTAQGVKLLAHSADAEAARALLAAMPLASDGSAPVDPAASAPQVSTPRMKLSVPQLAVGTVLGVLLCLLYQHTRQLGSHTYGYDYDGDGTPDETVVYRDGRCIEQSLDRNSDGTMDIWYYYNPEGRFKEMKSDDNFDGRLDATYRYTNGFLAEAKMDTDFNGTTDVTYFYKHELLKQSAWRPNGAPVVTLQQIFRNGILTAEWRDTNSDGVFDATNQFDAFLNRIETNSFNLLSSPQP